ncbi:receptor activity-modifying protein 2 [Mixophyes fleayi]|uniref:receptor activity-modifying protein 2 n=1 Tax=Mixophyes fleayi TaxID=3061075 RepID=UPI003F4DBCD0
MESTFLCTLTSALCLFTWASSLMTVPQNVTQSPVNVSIPINATLLVHYYYYEVDNCTHHFHSSMSKMNPEHWCEWDDVISFYDKLQICIEDATDGYDFPYPNVLTHDIFLSIHKHYFANCTLLSEEILDPPEHVLLALIFVPICIIPFLVTLVVYKSNTNKLQT